MIISKIKNQKSKINQSRIKMTRQRNPEACEAGCEDLRLLRFVKSEK
jgi:hypothetical protein